jgi:hypothetical protein
MKALIFFLFLCFVPMLTYASDVATEKELVGILNELLDAIAPGKTEVWEKYLADSCLFTDENGKTYSKKELLADFQPLPPGFTGNIKVENAQSQIYGDTAILIVRELEHMNIFGQQITQRYMQTNTFVRMNQQWKLVAAQVLAVNNDPPMINLNPESLKKYEGTYQLGEGQTYTLTVENGKLIAQRTGRDKEEILPETENVFFRKGSPRSRILFLRDESGNVNQMAFRREGIDVLWKKIPNPKS